MKDLYKTYSVQNKVASFTVIGFTNQRLTVQLMKVNA